MSSEKTPETRVSLNALEYEDFVRLTVEALFKRYGAAVHAGRHYRGLSGHDHQIDVSVDLSIAKFRILILFECKHYRRAVGVEDLLEFAQRLSDIGAHKGVVVSTVGFQKGATKVAEAHGIALVRTVPQKDWKTVESRHDWILDTMCEMPRLSLRVEDVDPEPELKPGFLIRLWEVAPTTIALLRFKSNFRDFADAWRSIIHDLATAHLETFTCHIRCSACGGTDYQEVQGTICPVCGRPIESAAFTSKNWIRCDCSKMLHKSDLNQTYARCGCGAVFKLTNWMVWERERITQLIP